jgi:hypothetical protein
VNAFLRQWASGEVKQSLQRSAILPGGGAPPTRACARGLPRTHTTLGARPCEPRPIGPRAKERGAYAANKKMGQHANDKLSDAFTKMHPWVQMPKTPLSRSDLEFAARSLHRAPHLVATVEGLLRSRGVLGRPNPLLDDDFPFSPDLPVPEIIAEAEAFARHRHKIEQIAAAENIDARRPGSKRQARPCCDEATGNAGAWRLLFWRPHPPGVLSGMQVKRERSLPCVN